MNYPKSYARMSPAALRALLSKRRLPSTYIENTIHAVLTDRQAARPALKKSEQHARLWGYLIDPAKAELRNVQRMLKLKLSHPTPERIEALEAYAALLTFLIGRLTMDMKSTTDMPKHLAAERKLPNGGEYWVDWVPPKKVALIYAFFAAIPKARGVKRKEPFPVVLDKATSARRKTILIERTTKEIEHVERRIAAELADPRLTDTHYFKQQEIGAMRLEISKMQAALHIISQLPANALVPPTWHGVMQQRTAPGEPAAKPTKGPTT